jgi:hypothetical protein
MNIVIFMKQILAAVISCVAALISIPLFSLPLAAVVMWGFGQAPSFSVWWAVLIEEVLLVL